MASDSFTAAIDPTARRAQARVGTTLRGKWHIDSLLGVGGMASVYAATHRNGTRAALKILHPELTTHSDMRARFFREGRVANVVGHPGAVKVVDEDEAEDGAIFLVMELLDGESLEARATRSGGKLPLDEVLAASDQLLDVLIAAHQKGVIHRDLKPDNVFLTRDGVVKVLDFGIARLRELSTASSATHTGVSMGTPAFMAPEQARGLWDEVDAQSDLWAAGAMMFRLLTGRNVHEARTTNEILLAAMTEPARAVGVLEPKLHSAAATVVDRALAFDKSRRWPDARAMQEAVRHAFHDMHKVPISTAPKLVVPPSVVDRTLPGADVGPLAALRPSGTTGLPVATGRTGNSMVRTRPLLTALGASGIAVGLVLFAASALIAVKGRKTTSELAGPAEAVVDPERAPSAIQTASAIPAASAEDASPPVVTLDELPPVAPTKKPAARKPTSWKDQRK